MKDLTNYFDKIWFKQIKKENLYNCPKCGNKINKEYNYCPNCGIKLK